MRHRVSGRVLGRPTAHRISLFRNLTRDLIIREAIVTTEPKAKEARSFAEKVITLGKNGSLPSRRRALSFINDKEAIAKVFDVLSDRYEGRQGGYTRITKLGPRRGDAAPMVRLELV